MKPERVAANAEQRALIREGLADPVVRAFVKIVAVMRRLPDDDARARVLTRVHRILELERELAELRCDDSGRG